MKSLRSRLARLLVGAILGVVMIAALVAILVLEHPDRDNFSRVFAEEVRIVASVLRSDPAAAEQLGIEVGPEPLRSGAVVVRSSRGIGETLADAGLDIPVQVVDDRHTGARQLAFEFAPGRWAYLPYLGMPPRRWPVFLAYMAAVALGAVAVSMFTANKMTRPLRILDQAVTTIGPDGLPAHIPEDGPAEVRATASALNRLTSQVRTAVESRMRLVAAAGHDLRTPMTRMRLRAEFFPDDERGTWLKDLAELDRIADSAIRLVREEVDPNAAEETEIISMVDEIASELREIGRNVEFEPDPEEAMYVLARPLALKRALRNLIENAAVHGEIARIAVSRSGNTGLLEIRDEGPGIPEELINRAFEPFFRVDPGRRQLKPGAGLGMAIAKEIVDQIGGLILIANRPGGGLSQRIELPLLSASG
ncbi:MAG: ATP-binding protein [Pseudomonadota bacterium]|nr:ATP-binding protein [Pseudomonadota bacterium]